MSNPTDGELVYRAQHGDKGAFAQLFTRYEGRIFGYLYRMVGDRNWAEDLAQEAFIRAHQHLGRLGPPYDFKSWIYRIAANLALDGLRAYRREIPLPDWDAGDAAVPEPADTSAAADPQRQVGLAEVRAAVWQTLHRLPDAYRQVLLLRELEGLSYQEMASVLALSVDNVKVTLHRARLAFRDLYGVRVMAEEGRLVCQELDELLSAEMDGELDRGARRRVKAHIAVCLVCQRTRKELLTVSSLLAALAPVFPPPRLEARFLSRLQSLPSPQRPPPLAGKGGPPWPGKEFWLVLLGGAGGMLFLGTVAVAFLLVLSGASSPSAAVPSPSPAPLLTLPPLSMTAAPTNSPGPLPTALPTARPSPTASPTPEPTATSTSTPSPTATPTPGPYIVFWADATTVPAGSCTNIHWETAEVAAVYFDGQGVPGWGGQQACPCAPESHTLEVVLRDGSHDLRTLTLTVTGTCVTPTPDMQGPPAPLPLEPVGNVVLTCRSWVLLSWSQVSDPSGLTGYQVVLQERIFVRPPQSWEWGPVSATSLEVPVSCGFAYRWAVRAQDGVGNWGPWSDGAQFGVGID